jgi:Cache domain.
MTIRDEYSSWPLGRQLQVLFIGAGLLLTGILIIITKFQLDWLRSQVTTKSSVVLTDNLLKQMRDLGSMEAQYIASEFSNYITFAKNLKRTDSIVLGFGYYNNTNPFKQGTVVNSSSITQGTITYSTGVYFTSESSLDSAGVNLENTDTSMDAIYPLIYQDSYLGYYQGYEQNQIIHYYPGSLTTDTTYTPLVREWYYKAAENTSRVIITEPYTDSTTGYWIVTISKAITDNNNKLFGVAGVDVTLKSLTSDTSNVKILNSGFLMLVSAGGMILTLPAGWDASGSSTLRIYDTTNTGITSDQ